MTTPGDEDPREPRDPSWTRDELILICEALARNSWKQIRAGDPRAIELARILRSLPIHPLSARTAKFRSPASVQRKGADILTRLPSYSGVPTRGGRLDGEVLTQFLTDAEAMSRTAHALQTLDRQELPEALPEDLEDFEDEAPEGRLLYRRHRIYERSRSLRLKRVEAARRDGEVLACQACGFDFAEVYGSLGEGYIQVHHLLPLHESGQVRTRLVDLALLCANCHVMAHRARPWPSVSELQSLIGSTGAR